MLGKQNVPDKSAKASFQNKADKVFCFCDQASEKLATLINVRGFLLFHT